MDTDEARPNPALIGLNKLIKLIKLIGLHCYKVTSLYRAQPSPAFFVLVLVLVLVLEMPLSGFFFVRH